MYRGGADMTAAAAAQSDGPHTNCLDSKVVMGALRYASMPRI
jgi:hypothetical protein